MVEYPIVAYAYVAPIWKVYMHINIQNNKKYVGITSQSLRDRWGKGSGYRKGSPFRKAIDCYGWDNFAHILLLDGLTMIEARILERHYIKKYKTHVGMYGYNVKIGGEFGNLSKPPINMRKVICLNTLHVFESIAQASQFYNISPSNIQSVCNGAKRNFAGQYHGEFLCWMYYDEYLTTSHEEIDMKLRKKTHNVTPRPVLCLNTFSYYENASICGNEFGLTSSAITNACINHIAVVKEYQMYQYLYFCFADDYFRLDYNKQWLLHQIFFHGNRDKIYCVETGQIFNNSKEASLALNIQDRTIRKACNNPTKRCGKATGNNLGYGVHLQWYTNYLGLTDGTHHIQGRCFYANEKPYWDSFWSELNKEENI